MDDFVGFIIFALVFVLGPVLEQLRKKNQPPQQPPKRVEPRPQPLPQQRQSLPPRSTTEEVSGKPRESAAAMVPDDLWKILTGEARPTSNVPVETKPAPVDAKKRPWDVVYIPPEETEDEEALAVEDVNVEVKRTTREEVKREHAVRHKPVEAASLEVTQANIVSLETPVASSAARHTAFHQRLSAKPAVAAKVARKSFIGGREDLMRAFVMQEILGKPRGLD